MAREQGDALGDEVVYVHPEKPKAERRAFSPADHVNLQARGWVRRDTKTTPAKAKSGTHVAAGENS